MKNNFISKFILQEITKELKEETQKRYIEGRRTEKRTYKKDLKSYINSNYKIAENTAKKLMYRKLLKHISFISNKNIQKIFKNSNFEDFENLQKITTEDIEIIEKINKKNSKFNLIYEIMKYYNLSFNSEMKMKCYNLGAVYNAEDIIQLILLEMLENKKRIFYNNEKIIASYKAIKNIYNSINNYIQRTHKEDNKTHFEDFEKSDFLENIIVNTEIISNEIKDKIINKMFLSIELTPKQKNIVNLLYKTNLIDKDIYNNLGITKQGFYKHLRKIKSKCIEYIKTNKLENIIQIA